MGTFGELGRLRREDADKLMEAVTQSVGGASVLAELGILNARAMDSAVDDAVRFRFSVGKEFLEACERLDLSNPVLARFVIGRAYYAVYHCARAYVFHKLRKDIEEHQQLIKQLKTENENIGKDVEALRAARNRCDYDVHSGFPDLAESARLVLTVAEILVKDLGIMLGSRGVKDL